MATQLAPSGVYKPEKYPQGSIGSYYQHYGEQPGYIYLPWKDRYVPDPKAQQQYLEESGLKEPEKKSPGVGETLGYTAAGAAALAGGKYVGEKALDYDYSKLWSDTPSTTSTGGTASNQVGLLSGAQTSPVGATGDLQGQYTLNGQLQVQQPTTTDGGLKTDTGLKTEIDGGTNYGAYAQGAAGAGQLYGAYEDYKDKEYTGAAVKGAAGAANVGAAAGSTTAASAVPYVNAALAGYNVHQAKNAEAPANTRAAMAAHEGAVGAANYFTFGLAGLADFAIKKWAPSWYESHIKRHSKTPFAKTIGGFWSGKDEYQWSRDQGRKYLKENKILDDKYIGTLADGSKFDFGKDGKSIKIDYKDPVTGEVIAKADLLAAAEGFTGKAREGMAMLYTNAALSNSGGDVNKAYSNIAHFMKQRGMTSADILKQLEEEYKKKELSEDRYNTYKATNQNFTTKYVDNVGLLSNAKNGSPGKRPGKNWDGNKYVDNKKPLKKKTDQVFNKVTQQEGAI